MLALQRNPSFHQFTTKLIALIASLLAAAFLSACGGGLLTTDQTFAKIKPKEQLPEREMRDQPHNVLVKIHNVADAGRSYKNFVRLYVNGKEIAPVENVSNFTSTYTFPMRLQQGIYEIKAEYHVVGFWREKVFEIEADEPVKILPEKRTILEASLQKDGSGQPVKNSARFRLTYESLVAAAEDRIEASPGSRPIITGTAPSPENRGPIVPRPKIERPPIEPELLQPQPERPVDKPDREPVAPDHFTILQINTSPSGADVIVDDKYYGQTPLRVSVSTNHDHVIQISRAGHQDLIKVLDAHQLSDQEMVQLLFKLETQQSPDSRNLR